MVMSGCFITKIRNKTKILPLPPVFNIVLEDLSIVIGKKKQEAFVLERKDCLYSHMTASLLL
jgi:hypothetical protein